MAGKIQKGSFCANIFFYLQYVLSTPNGLQTKKRIAWRTMATQSAFTTYLSRVVAKLDTLAFLPRMSAPLSLARLLLSRARVRFTVQLKDKQLLLPVQYSPTLLCFRHRWPYRVISKFCLQVE